MRRRGLRFWLCHGIQTMGMADCGLRQAPESADACKQLAGSTLDPGVQSERRNADTGSVHRAPSPRTERLKGPSVGIYLAHDCITGEAGTRCVVMCYMFSCCVSAALVVPEC